VLAAAALGQTITRFSTTERSQGLNENFRAYSPATVAFARGDLHSLVYVWATRLGIFIHGRCQDGGKLPPCASGKRFGYCSTAAKQSPVARTQPQSAAAHGVVASLAMTMPVILDMIDKAFRGDLLPATILVSYLALGLMIYKGCIAPKMRRQRSATGSSL
jgi:hypothetical protein